jgi:hypothetical protein
MSPPSPKPSSAIARALSLLLAASMLTAGVLKAQGCQSAPPSPEAQAPTAEPQAASGGADMPLPPQDMPDDKPDDSAPDLAEPEFFPATKSGMPVRRPLMPATKSAAPMPDDGAPQQQAPKK